MTVATELSFKTKNQSQTSLSLHRKKKQVTSLHKEYRNHNTKNHYLKSLFFV